MQKDLQRESRFLFLSVCVTPYLVVFIVEIRGYCYTGFKDLKLQVRENRIQHHRKLWYM